MMLEVMHRNEFNQVFSIMESSFPIDERRLYEEQKELLNDPMYRIYVLRDNGKNVLKAFIAIWQFTDFAFVEHFAVNQAYRNQGLGALILHEIVQSLSSQICLEVEFPETDFAKRRIEFYKRNGFFLNEYPYIQPPISKGRNPLPLILMTSKEGISPERFAVIKDSIYRVVYKVSPAFTADPLT